MAALTPPILNLGNFNPLGMAFLPVEDPVTRTGPSPESEPRTTPTLPAWSMVLDTLFDHTTQFAAIPLNKTHIDGDGTVYARKTMILHREGEGDALWSESSEKVDAFINNFFDKNAQQFIEEGGAVTITQTGVRHSGCDYSLDHEPKETLPSGFPNFGLRDEVEALLKAAQAEKLKIVIL